ncbi:uncharacterized protein N7473_000417 [Penicillium subrubescens]|uniref:uncharacterized protein n=1 Tax=Penicillium subrubescens TaxID=1316194 RepID=UPI002544EB47|nr:uncharacterized protein N7473_000417 [Penicillium subrubescens]KAJ5911114.1 hypothetical protein N7473_000417 [Penicillium subrubescens]
MLFASPEDANQQRAGASKEEHCPKVLKTRKPLFERDDAAVALQAKDKDWNGDAADGEVELENPSAR